MLLTLMVIAGVLSGLLLIRARQIAMRRLILLGIVDHSSHAKLIYASGIWRESTLVFQTTRFSLKGQAAKPDKYLGPLSPPYDKVEVDIGILQRAVDRAVGKIELTEYRCFRGFDNSTLTLYFLAIAPSGDPVYIVVQPF